MNLLGAVKWSARYHLAITPSNSHPITVKAGVGVRPKAGGRVASAPPAKWAFSSPCLDLAGHVGVSAFDVLPTPGSGLRPIQASRGLTVLGHTGLLPTRGQSIVSNRIRLGNSSPRSHLSVLLGSIWGCYVLPRWENPALSGASHG